MRAALRFFYGWFLVAVAWVIYGFGIAPGYYSWGFFSPEIIRDLGLNRTQTGAVFGVFTFTYSGISPITGMAISRWGTRTVMVVGSLIAALAFLLLRGADTLTECFIYYGALAGIGIGLSTILPCQTLATNWFTRYRARAVALIFIAGGIVGRLVTWFDVLMVQQYSWRTGWLVIAGVSTLVAVLAALFIRNRPGDVGEHPDGIAPDGTDEDTPAEPVTTPADLWTPGKAIRTPQFAVLCLCGIAYVAPWSVTVGHGRLHLQDLGFSTDLAAGVLGTMILVSIVGRLTGSLGDFLVPEKVLGYALMVEALGMVGFLTATTPAMAYVSTILIALGYGTAYIVITVVFSKFFGRVAFAQTNGTRFLITGIFNAIAPAAAGLLFDATGTYRIAFIAIAVLGTVGGIATLRLRTPKPPVVAAAPV